MIQYAADSVKCTIIHYVVSNVHYYRVQYTVNIVQSTIIHYKVDRVPCTQIKCPVYRVE